MAHAIFYMHQTSGVCAVMCTCDHTHQMEKTGLCGAPLDDWTNGGYVEQLLRTEVGPVLRSRFGIE